LFPVTVQLTLLMSFPHVKRQTATEMLSAQAKCADCYTRIIVFASVVLVLTATSAEVSAM